ncbi:DUF262 domain-containing protein [Bradyrhizobium sp. AUGA SZCCT0222]|uniref:DUF262 domain-containing protein n=1 Tax=Bradyrhizobium sp. AUGA SZCCT0222 TaxID=2807668 RepID=UPI001BA7545F|nr:DUF262 domain-containing protein [Bradyrhizobium sp. AUGA SZCCT0222]MBR1265936.1 DUF262 domain-containing protein [Bradyrhizobium sp. AUGA SZCCT0222]
MAESKTLEAQIAEARRSISSDGYPMSIGELTSLYRNGELIIRPEFQRLFRWSNLQKSRLIESILLGIPLPSIFVAQTETGKWELVDGLQRVSTILQLQGELLDENSKPHDKLVLEGTTYLPALEGRVWESKTKSQSLSEAQRLDIKRSKIDIKIIKRDSSPQAKYDLFHRLNSYGTPLTPAELRTSLLVAVSPEFFTQVEQMASYSSFAECVSLSERMVEERFDLELVTRFLILHNWPSSKLNLTSLRDLPKVLDDEIVNVAMNSSTKQLELKKVFEATFDLIAKSGGEQLFRRWEKSKSDFTGSFLLSAFEIFGLGVGYHLANNKKVRKDLLAAAKEVWTMPKMQAGFATGRSTEARLLEFIPLGRTVTAG